MRYATAMGKSLPRPPPRRLAAAHNTRANNLRARVCDSGTETDTTGESIRHHSRIVCLDRYLQGCWILCFSLTFLTTSWIHQGVKGHLHQSMSLQSRFLRSGSSFKFPLRRHLRDLKIQLFDLLLNSECLPGILSSPLREFMHFLKNFCRGTNRRRKPAVVNEHCWCVQLALIVRPSGFTKWGKCPCFCFVSIHQSFTDAMKRLWYKLFSGQLQKTALHQPVSLAVGALWFRLSVDLTCQVESSQKFGDLRLVTDKTQIKRTWTWLQWLETDDSKGLSNEIFALSQKLRFVFPNMNHDWLIWWTLAVRMSWNFSQLLSFNWFNRGNCCISAEISAN